MKTIAQGYIITKNPKGPCVLIEGTRVSSCDIAPVIFVRSGP